MVSISLDLFPAGLYVLVGAGALMMAVGFFGCCGAMRESQCVLGSVSGASGEGICPKGARSLASSARSSSGPLRLGAHSLSKSGFLHFLHKNNIIFVPTSDGMNV